MFHTPVRHRLNNSYPGPNAPSRVCRVKNEPPLKSSLFVCVSVCLRPCDCVCVCVWVCVGVYLIVGLCVGGLLYKNVQIFLQNIKEVRNRKFLSAGCVFEGGCQRLEISGITHPHKHSDTELHFHTLTGSQQTNQTQSETHTNSHKPKYTGHT